MEGNETERKREVSALQLLGWPSDDPMLSLAGKHPALAVSSVIVSAAILKLLLATRMQPESALALLGAAAPTTIVLGLLLTITPTLVVYVGVLALWVQLQYRREGRASWVLSFVWPPLFGFAIFYLPLIFLGFVVALILVGFVAALRWKNLRSTARLGRLLDAGIYVLISTVLISSAVWMPPEVVRLAEGNPVVAFVAGTQGPWLVLLREDDRRVLYVRQDDVESREVCTHRSGVALSLTELFSERTPPLATCP